MLLFWVFFFFSKNFYEFTYRYFKSVGKPPTQKKKEKPGDAKQNIWKKYYNLQAIKILNLFFIVVKIILDRAAQKASDNRAQAEADTAAAVASRQVAEAALQDAIQAMNVAQEYLEEAKNVKKKLFPPSPPLSLSLVLAKSFLGEINQAPLFVPLVLSLSLSRS